MEDPLVAELAYRETVGARSRTRAIRRSIAVPLRLLAAVDLVGAGIVLVIGQYHLLSYFGPAMLGVLGISFWWYRRFARACGLQFPVWPWAAIIVASLLIGASLSHQGLTSGRQWISDVGPPLTLAAATAVVAGWLRSRRLAATAAAMAGTALVLAPLVHGDLDISLQLFAFAALLWFGSSEPKVSFNP